MSASSATRAARAFQRMKACPHPQGARARDGSCVDCGQMALVATDDTVNADLTTAVAPAAADGDRHGRA